MSYTNQIQRGQKFEDTDFLKEIWRYRDLCMNLVGADLRARFRRSRIGVVWAGIQPLAFALLVSLVWSVVFEQSLAGFSVYVLSGMIVWEYVSNTVTASQDSFITAEGYLKQGRIPLLVFQLRTPITGMVTFLIGYLVLIALLFVLKQTPPVGLHTLLALAYLPLILAFVTPLACIFAILGTLMRDMRHAMLIVLNAVFFLSPIIVLRSYLESESLLFLQYANPLIPLLDMFRAPVLDGQAWSLLSFQIVIVWIVGLWLLAIIMSKKVGRKIVFAL